ncbi:MAG: ISAs1 family transposase [Anaerolineales bacterium]|nr:ISAs1 family transposase [Anaerolineales bacterium]
MRAYWTISDPETLRSLRGLDHWEKLTTVSCIRSQRWIGDEKSSQGRYHIDRITGAKQVLSAVRSHWGIGNQLHWRFDNAFDEDCGRIRQEHGAENFAVLRHSAITLLKQEETCKRSINLDQFLQVGYFACRTRTLFNPLASRFKKDAHLFINKCASFQ